MPDYKALLFGFGISLLSTTSAGAQDNNPTSTVAYGQDFIKSFPNAVTIVDIIERIPGGELILSSGGGNARGFSNNRDSILINGKRISGKSNDGHDALTRITVDQVERIEVIRGGSPDVKSSSQDAILNIILRESDIKSSGSWEGSARVFKHGPLAYSGKLTYGGALDRFDYSLSLTRFARAFNGQQTDREFDGANNLTRQLNEIEQNRFKEHSVSGNLAYNFENGDIWRANGKWEIDDLNGGQPGTFFTPDQNGVLIEDGQSFRTFILDAKPDELELSSDYEAAFGDAFKFKALALYSKSDRRFLQAEDFDITGGVIEDDFRFISSDLAKEKIGRTTLTWAANERHSLEIGTEFAFNTLNSGLQFFERNNGVLTEQDISGADLRVKETRNESFVTHSWALTSKLSLETTVISEYSEIRQTGDGTNRNETFYYIKPSTDLRFNISDRKQVQFSVRRIVDQLNFGDFASGISGDDEVVGANEELVPQKAWEVETSFEYRLKDDAGSFKVSGLYEAFQDRISRIETSPGISGVGNVGNAHRMGLDVDANLRLDFLGLTDALLETGVSLTKSSERNPFTNERNRFNFNTSAFFNIGYRQDIRSAGFSYGIDYIRYSRSFFRDIDEVLEFKGPRHFLEIFIEKTLWHGITLEMRAENLLNTQTGRTRFLFEDGVANGRISSSIDRSFKKGQELQVQLKGVF